MLMKLDLLTLASTFCSGPVHPGQKGGPADAMLLALAFVFPGFLEKLILAFVHLTVFLTP